MSGRRRAVRGGPGYLRPSALLTLVMLAASGGPALSVEPPADRAGVPVAGGPTPVAGGDSMLIFEPDEGQPGSDAGVGPGDDAPTDAPPAHAPATPQPADPAPPSAEEALVAEAMARRLEEARLALMVALGLEAQAAAMAQGAEADVAAARARLAAVDHRERAAVRALVRQRRRVNRWAVQAYTGGSLRRVAYVLESDDIGELSRRIGLAAGAFGGVEEDLRQQERDLAAVAAGHREVVRELADAEERLVRARESSDAAASQVAQRRSEVAALDALAAASVAGVAFPVSGPARFADTFGAPRMPGSPYAHLHQGVDIFAPAGAPVVAFERGRVVRLGTDVLGGIKLWLAGESGTRYYYAHLQAYVPGLVEGQVVEVGRVLAYVGNTGNARTTPHHLHFEIHPGASPPVNPYPIVAQINAVRTGAAAVAAQGAPVTSTPAPAVRRS